MPVASAALQLAVENALKDFIAAQNVFPAAFGFHAAHSLSTPASKDRLDVIADIPRWESRGIAGVRVEFQVCTDLADSEKRPDQTTQAQEYLGDLIELFMENNFFASRDALNAISASVGFSGWEPAPAEDGQDKENKILAPVVIYLFRVHRK